MNPELGMRVRYLRGDHKSVPQGMTGTIDVVNKNGVDFWVATDSGGFYGWTSLKSW